MVVVIIFFSFFLIATVGDPLSHGHYLDFHDIHPFFLSVVAIGNPLGRDFDFHALHFFSCSS